jgi:hypothetical protein
MTYLKQCVNRRTMMIFPLILRYFVIEFANIIFSATQIYYPIIIAMLLMYEL